MDVIRRGQEAKRLLNEPLLKEAFDGVRMKILERLEEVAIGDVDTQHELTLCLQTIKQVKRYMENWMRDGQLEEIREAEKSKFQRFLQRTGAKTNG